MRPSCVSRESTLSTVSGSVETILSIFHGAVSRSCSLAVPPSHWKFPAQSLQVKAAPARQVSLPDDPLSCNSSSQVSKPVCNALCYTLRNKNYLCLDPFFSPSSSFFSHSTADKARPCFESGFWRHVPSWLLMQPGHIDMKNKSKMVICTKAMQPETASFPVSADPCAPFLLQNSDFLIILHECFCILIGVFKTYVLRAAGTFMTCPGTRTVFFVKKILKKK